MFDRESPSVRAGRMSRADYRANLWWNQALAAGGFGTPFVNFGRVEPVLGDDRDEVVGVQIAREACGEDGNDGQGGEAPPVFGGSLMGSAEIPLGCFAELETGQPGLYF